MRFTGHLDLHRAWERTFRRARLPLAYTQGYHPQPRIQLAGALPLGFTSAAELADIWLEQDLAAEAALDALHGAAPPGLSLLGASVIDDRWPPLQVLLRSATYTVTLAGPAPDLAERVSALLAQTALPRTRRDKAYDLRPLIESLEPAPAPQTLTMQLAARDAATGRPEEVVDALGLESAGARYHRTGLLLDSPTTRLVAVTAPAGADDRAEAQADDPGPDV